MDKLEIQELQDRQMEIIKEYFAIWVKMEKLRREFKWRNFISYCIEYYKLAKEDNMLQEEDRLLKQILQENSI